MPVVRKTLPAAEWLPDMPPLNNPGSANIRNVWPRTPLSYGPIPTAMPLVASSVPAGSQAKLNKVCQGAVGVLDNLGNPYLFAGDANDLYLMDAANTGSWAIVSQTTGGYNAAAGTFWHFAFFNGILIATNGIDPPQQFTPGTSTLFSDLSADAPKGKYVASVQGFLMFANTDDSVNGQQSQWAWWSGFNNPTNWPTPGGQAAAEVQSSFNPLYGEWGAIQGVVGNLGGIAGAVFMQHGVYQIIYTGPPSVFSFIPVEGVKGCIAPASIVQVGSIVYYLAEDGWRAFDGSSSTLIGANKIDQTFFADLDTNNLGRVVGTVDPFNKLIWWAYPGSGNNDGNPNHLLVYNWNVNRWSIIDQECEAVTRLFSLGYTLDQLYTVLGYLLDNLPAPLDSPQWSGGAPLLSLFDTTHGLNTFSGTSMAATIDTTELEPFPGSLTLIDNARPLVDGGLPSVATGVRDRLIDLSVLGDAVPIDATGRCPQRANGRYVKGEITIPAGAAWNHAQGLELEVIQQGIR